MNGELVSTVRSVAQSTRREYGLFSARMSSPRLATSGAVERSGTVSPASTVLSVP